MNTDYETLLDMIERMGFSEFLDRFDRIRRERQEEAIRQEEIREDEIRREFRRPTSDKIFELMMENVEFVNTRKTIVKNIIITSPTQVGKTDYIIDSCKNAVNTGVLIVISCDNSIAQINQLNERLDKNGIRPYPLTKSSPLDVGEILKSGKSVVITMLNNSSQIQKLFNFTNDIKFVSIVPRYAFFHDEADMLNKTDEIADISNGDIPISHRGWVNLIDTLALTGKPIFRGWVSATPENCSHIDRICGKNIIVLPPNESYVGVTDHEIWSPNDLGSELALDAEVSRIRENKTREVILYCVDKTNEEQDKTAKKISRDHSCVSVSLNMQVAVLYNNGVVVNGLIGKKDSVSVILDKTRNLCENSPMVIVGFNLMNRGISFVGKAKIDSTPPSATVMFYAGGVNSHAIGVAQRFGRICGTSRPDIRVRKVYCSTSVYDDYCGYIANQNITWDALGNIENSDLTICEILRNCEGATKLGRPLDRPTLKNVNRDFSTVGIRDVPVGEYDTDKMHRLVNRWNIATNTSTIATIFRDILASDEKRIINSMLRDKIRRKTANGSFYTNMTAPVTDDNPQGLVFRTDRRYHYIRDEVLTYLGM